MEELLSLQWNNHKHSFIHLLSVLRKKNAYTDVTLACDGQLYNAHKMVLSACSDYFSNIFENISCSNPVIVLKDMTGNNLEALLDYMYLGEVSVKQCDLSSLIQSAECLKLKGLAVPDSETSDKSENKKRPADSSPNVRKKIRKSTIKNITENSKEPAKPDLSYKYEADIIPSPNTPSVLKTEDASDDVISIKNEIDIVNEELPFNLDQQVSLNHYQQSIPTTLSGNISDTAEDSNTIFFSDPYETGNVNNETSSFETQSFGASSSQLRADDTEKSLLFAPDNYCCTYCNKLFRLRTDLKRHTSIHTDEKIFACIHCPYRSNRKGNLVRHNVLRHPTLLI